MCAFFMEALIIFSYCSFLVQITPATSLLLETGKASQHGEEVRSQPPFQWKQGLWDYIDYEHATLFSLIHYLFNWLLSTKPENHRFLESN